jgi:hypothetical protein
MEPYKTSDTPLAAYLYMKGMNVLTAMQSPSDPQRKDFVFVDTPEREEYVKEYRDSGISEYRKAYKELIRMVREEQ